MAIHSPVGGAHQTGDGRRDQGARLRRWVLAAAAAAALATLAGSLGFLGWWLELLAHFRLQYAATLTVCAVVLLVIRPRVAGLLCLAIAALAAAPARPYWPHRPAATAGVAFDVMLANLWYRNGQHARVLDFVRETDPDVIVFLEVTDTWHAALEPLAVDYPWRLRSGELLLVSRLPLERPRAWPMPGDSGVTLAAVSREGARLALLGAHLSWPLGAAAARRQARQLELLAHVAGAVDGPRLLVGDLNTTPFSTGFARLLSASRLADCSLGRGWRPTWSAWFTPLAIPIDHCLHSPQVRIESIRSGPYLGSDHYPLRVRVRVSPPAATPVAQPRPLTAARAARRTGRR